MGADEGIARKVVYTTLPVPVEMTGPIWRGSKSKSGGRSKRSPDVFPGWFSSSRGPVGR